MTARTRTNVLPTTRDRVLALVTLWKELAGALQARPHRRVRGKAERIVQEIDIREMAPPAERERASDEAGTHPKDVLTGDSSLHDVAARFHSFAPSNETVAIVNGIPARTWKALELLGFERHELAGVIGSSEKTIQRKIATSDTLGVAEGDRTMRLVRIALQAIEAFDDVEKALTWLRRPNRALGDTTPIVTIATEAGAALVRRALGVIEYGGVA